MRAASLKSDLAVLAEGVRAGDRAALGRAITLIESKRTDHAGRAQELLQELLPFTGKATRVGITGVPGAGKSMLIDALGRNLTREGRRVAVLAVDPTSQLTGGSILGDKTRMARLAADPRAFIRPSPTGATLGGVARRTRETMLVCEAAGYDVVLVETVGIGQSETAVAGMVDFFLVLLVPGAGDGLQGIKKGLIELADMIVVNKADGDNLDRACAAQAEYQGALNILLPDSLEWMPPVITVSGKENIGLERLWAEVERHRALGERTGALAKRRSDQQVAWMWAMLEERMLEALKSNPHVKSRLPALEAEVRKGRLTPQMAVRELARLMGLRA